MSGGYGEPWSDEYGPDQLEYILDSTGEAVGAFYGDYEKRDRAIACVNALDGLNPDKLPVLLEEIEMVLDDYQYDYLFDGIREALAALQTKDAPNA